MERMEELWISLKERLLKRLSEGSYRLWIQPLVFGGFKDNTLIINCPNQFTASWVQEHYLPLIKEDIKKEAGDCKIRLVPLEKVKESRKNQLHLPAFHLLRYHDKDSVSGLPLRNSWSATPTGLPMRYAGLWQQVPRGLKG